MAKIKGIDVSYWQGNINFKKVAEDGIKFAILRQGYRKTIDSKFIEYAKGCKENNIPIMVYHFIYTDNATIQQNAQSTYDNVKKAGLDPTKTWIAADLEYDTWVKNKEKCTKAKCTKYTKQYLNALKKLGCNKLIIYCNNDYYQNYYDWSQLKYPIWLADYSGKPDHNCIIHQYSSKGKIRGINNYVDLNELLDPSILLENNVTSLKQSTIKKSTEQLAKEVLEGKWGNGDQRKQKLTEAGYDYTTVQNKVNELLKKPTTTINKITGITPEMVINVMRGWIGMSRSAGTHKPIIDIYNSYTPRARGYKVTYSDAYCDTTISAAFIKLNAVNLIGGTECGVQNHVALFKKAGIWEENGNVTPSPGWLIVYNWNDATQPNDGYSDHIGIVESVNNKQITTIEGNTNGGVVGRRVIPVGWGYIRGYAKPKYDITPSNNVTTTIGNIPKTTTITEKESTTTTNIDYAVSFNKNIARAYATTANLNMRAGASTSKKVLTVIPKNSIVHCYGYYTNDWYYVLYNGKVGFCNKKWLK